MKEFQFSLSSHKAIKAIHSKKDCLLSYRKLPSKFIRIILRKKWELKRIILTSKNKVLTLDQVKGLLHSCDLVSGTILFFGVIFFIYEIFKDFWTVIAPAGKTNFRNHFPEIKFGVIFLFVKVSFYMYFVDFLNTNFFFD